MRVRVDASRDVLAVHDRLDDLTTRLHKYRVVADRRRRDPMWGTHGEATELGRLTVRHERTTEFLDGHLVATRFKPDDKVNSYLVDEDVTVLDDVDDDGDAKVIA